MRVRLGQPGSQAAGDPAPTATVLVSVSAGSPVDGWESELAFLALVPSLLVPPRPIPSRVLGIWPDAGSDRTVDIDADLLQEAADRVVAVVAAISEHGRTAA